MKKMVYFQVQVPSSQQMFQVIVSRKEFGLFFRIELPVGAVVSEKVRKQRPQRVIGIGLCLGKIIMR